MNRRTVKEFLHLRDWLDRASELVGAGRVCYDSDELRQEAGDSPMMKIVEAPADSHALGSPALTASNGQTRSPRARQCR
jgi:hypothetical protein